MSVSISFNLTGVETFFDTGFGVVSKDELQVEVSSVGIIPPSEWTVDGTSNSSTSVRVTYPGALGISGETLTITRNLSVDPLNPDTSLLNDYNSAGVLTNQAIREDLVNILRIISDFTGGEDTAVVNLTTINNRLTAAEGDIVALEAAVIAAQGDITDLQNALGEYLDRTGGFWTLKGFQEII